MKKLNLILLSILAFAFSLNAQEISFSFTGNHTCEYAPLDSVLVENLTQSGDTVLYWNDTVLTFDLTGVEMPTTMENDFYVSQNYPNPFSSQTKIDVFVPEQDDFTINVFDVTGRLVVKYKDYLERGLHNFTFAAGNCNNYILTVNSTKFLQKILMIRVGSDDQSAAEFTYNGIIPQSKSLLKSGKSYFPYEIGDELRFTGFIDGDYAEITDNPTTDQDYVFDVNNSTLDAPGTISGNITVCGEDSGETYSIAAVDGALSYTWTVPSGASITSGQGTTNITVDFGTSSGDICVTANNECGVGTPSCQTITVSDPVVTITGDTEICDGESTTLTASGGTSYQWNIGSTDPSIDVSGNGTYMVTVTDVNGCTSVGDITVTVNPNPIADAGSDETMCGGGSVEIGGSPTASGGSGGTYSYGWNPSTGLDNVTIANPIASPTSTETYTVFVTDENGCTATDEITLSVLPAPTADAGSDESLCEGGSVVIGGSPTASGGSGSGYTYAWGPSTGLSNTTVANPIANPVSTQIYAVTVTDVNGCTATDAVTVTINSNPTVNAGADVTICEGNSTVIGGSPTASGSGGYTYAWSPTSGLNDATSANPTANPASTETYTVFVTDENGCTATDEVTLTIIPAPTADAGSDEILCEGGSVEIGGSPTASGGSGSGYTYTWVPSTGLSSTTVANPIANPISSQTYAVTVTDVNGCTATDTVTVTINPNPTVNAGADVTICEGNSIEIGGSPTASGTGGYTYTWAPASGLNDATSANPMASPASTETYVVTVIDGNGCSGANDITVTVNPNPTAIAGSNSPLSVGEDLLLTETGGDAASWSWSGPDGFNTNVQNPTIPSVTTAASGTYTVNVTDANGCTASDDVTVTVTDDPIADAGDDQTICVGGNVEIGGSPTASGGSGGGYTYAWSPANGLSSTTVANPIASPASTETYIVTVTDGNLNTNTDAVTVTVSEPNPSISYNDPVCDGGVLDLEGLPSGMTLYNWMGPDSFSSTDENPSIVDVTTTASGTYYLTVTDSYGCTGATSTSITINDNPTADAGTEETICIGESIGIGGSPTASGGSGSGYTYAWSPASGLSSTSDANPNATPDATTTYSVTVIDGNGCTAIDTVQITVNDPNAQITSNSPVCYHDEITLSGSPNGMNSYAWTGPAWGNTQNGQDQTVNWATSGDEGWYELTVEDNNGCTSSTSVYVIVITGDPDAPTAASHTVGPDSIVWHWNSVAAATGYKYNTTDDYGSATDNGTDTSFLQTGLTCGTPYSLYVWAYDDCGGTSVSVELTTFTESCGPFVCGDYLIDTRDGSAYETLQIGNQCWMVENLNYAGNVNGSSWCYDDDPLNCDTCGRLYDWAAAMEGASPSETNPSDVQGVCPDGWHIPSDDEWKELEGEVDVTYNYGDSEWNADGNRGEDAGSALAGDASLWTDGTLEAHASFGTSGFNALPGGRRTTTPSYTGIGDYAYFWSTTEDDFFYTDAMSRSLNYNVVKSIRYNNNKDTGMSVRCVQD
ncbi:MAG: FISUMP domain-containing protein [Bacteroidota bacterium]|nr:FISUMP domain-containing protein [Bacteroidota bacterium]